MAGDPNVIRTILRVGAEMGMNERQLITALQTGIVESGLRNLRYGDRDSQGVFQQRPSMGWGSVAQVTNPEYAARKFFSELKKVWDPSKSNGHNAQHVQRSAFPERYQQRYNEAASLFRQYGNEIKGVDVPIGRGGALSGGKFGGKSKTKIEPGSAIDEDSDLLELLGSDYDDALVDDDEDEIEDMWYDAVQVMGDEVRGQFDPNGDLFDTGPVPGDADDMDVISADQQAGMMDAQRELAGMQPGVQELDMFEDPQGPDVEPISSLIGQNAPRSRVLNDPKLVNSMLKKRQEAFDNLRKQAKGGLGPASFGPGVRIGPKSNAGIPGGLRPNTSYGARVARNLGFGGTIGGIGSRGYKSDHPHGNAIDLMTYGQTQKGWALANYYHANRGKLKVKYIIFDNRISSPVDNWRWRTYDSTPDGNTSPTALHRDHVHISFH